MKSCHAIFRVNDPVYMTLQPDEVVAVGVPVHWFCLYLGSRIKTELDS